jgi:hypothetical protein
MEADKKLTTLEEELKLLKGELKQSLASVRDYLLNMELPASEFANVLASLDSAGTQKITLDGSLANKILPKSKDELAQEEEQEKVTEPESELPPEEEQINQDENPESEASLEEEETGEPDESLTPDAELPLEEETPMEYAKINAEASQAIPKVNLLANLIGWVAKAKKEIGSEQIPTFLEVYGISGHLSPELKEVILQLAEITSEQPENANIAELWSQSMLSLHGILTGGDAPLQTVRPFWHNSDSEIKPSEDKVTEADKPKDAPFKLKLVFPNGDGKSQEFCLDLKPEAANNGSQGTPKPKIIK